jgi:uncharacterized protein with ParB-like and HNH nuclease domain
MDVSKNNLGKLLNEFYEIPIYQRLYSWEEEHWRTLLESLISVYETPRENIFFGSLILKKNPDKPNFSNVIDGQQRLTTFCILLKVISDFLENYDYDSYSNKIKSLLKDDPTPNEFIYRIIHNEIDRKNFEKLIDSSYKEIQHHIKTEKYNKKSNIYACYNYLYKAIAGFNDDFNISANQVISLYTFIKDRCELIVITLDERDDEQEIFNTMNSTGLKLSISDLLKNQFFRDENLKNNYLTMWQYVFEGDEGKIDFWNTEVSKQGTTRFDFLLYTVALIEETNDAKYTLFTKKASYTKLLKIYKEYKNNDNILQRILGLGEKYLEFYENKTNLINLDDSKEFCLFLMETSGNITLMPIILFLETYDSLYKKEDEIRTSPIDGSQEMVLYNPSAEKIKEIYTLLSKLILIGFLTSSVSSQKNIANLFLHNIQIKGVNSAIKTIQIGTYYEDFYKIVLEKCEYSPRADRKLKLNIVFSIIEAYKRKKEGFDKFKYDKESYIDFILPKKLKAELKNEDLINSFGNLTLLNEKLKNSVYDLGFRSRKIQLQKNNYKINRFSIYNEFKDKEINERAEEFIGILYELVK